MRRIKGFFVERDQDGRIIRVIYPANGQYYTRVEFDKLIQEFEFIPSYNGYNVR